MEEFKISAVNIDSVSVIIKETIQNFGKSQFYTEDNRVAEAVDLVEGDFLVVSGDHFIVKLPLMNELESSNDLRGFPKWANIVFPYVRHYQKGGRNVFLAFGMRLIEWILLNNDGELVGRARRLLNNGMGMRFLEFVEAIRIRIENCRTKIWYFADKMVYIDNFAREIKRNQEFSALCALLDVKLTVYSLDMKQFITNETGSRKFDLLQIDNTWATLYTMQEFVELTQNPESIEFCKRVKEAAANTEKIKENLLKSQKNALVLDQALLNLTENYYFQADPDDFSNLMKYLQKRNYDTRLIQERIARSLCGCCKKKGVLIELNCGDRLCKGCLVRISRDSFKSALGLRTDLIFRCSLCSQQINSNIIKEHYQDYDESLAEIEKKKTFTCTCQFTGGKENFIGKCAHFCNKCIIMYIWFYPDIKSCYQCNWKYTDQELFQLKQIKKICPGCQKDLFFYNFFAYYRFCAHEFCLKCIKRCYFTKSCILGCGEIQNLPDISLEVQCENCGIFYEGFNTFEILKNCSCRVCLPCQAKNNLENCLICTRALGGSAMYELLDFGSIMVKRLKKCLVCDRDWDIEKMITLINCQHEACIDCHRNAIKTNLDEMKFNDCLSCFQCKKEIDKAQLENVIKRSGKENWDRLNYFLIQSDLINCPKCTYPFIPDKSMKVHCMNARCRYVFCKGCFQDYHPTGSCKDLLINNALELLEKNFSVEGVSQCPRCRFPYIKNAGCEHVICLDPECKTEFCFNCSCIRSPTMAHGAHYHRPVCRFFNNYNGEGDKMKATCEECTRIGSLCLPPKNLKVRCRVSIEEVPQ